MILQQPYRGRLAKLAIALIKNAEEDSVQAGDKWLDFDMMAFMTSEKSVIQPNHSACGTTCCFLGYAPFVFPEVRDFTSWDDVTDYVIPPVAERDASAGEFWSATWDFLFSSHWPDNPILAAARALNVLEKGVPPAAGVYRDLIPEPDPEYRNPEFPKRELLERLSHYANQNH